MRILALTFNMGAGSMDNKDMMDTFLENLFEIKRIDHDIYIFATQEALKSIPATMINPSTDEFDEFIN